MCSSDLLFGITVFLCLVVDVIMGPSATEGSQMGSIDAQASFYSSEFPNVSGAIIQPYTEDPDAKIYSANIVRRISNEVRAVFYFVPTHGSLGAAQSQTITNDVQFWSAQ